MCTHMTSKLADILKLQYGNTRLLFFHPVTANVNLNLGVDDNTYIYGLSWRSQEFEDMKDLPAGLTVVITGNSMPESVMCHIHKAVIDLM